jgi:hypothetical protein
VKYLLGQFIHNLTQAKERNISKLHTAGADLVMSYASLAANMILNLLKPEGVLMLADGLDVFRTGVHADLLGSP